MPARDDVLSRVASVTACAMFAAALGVMPQAATVTIRVWRIGSPHEGDTPQASIPPALARDAHSHGFSLAVETFPAKGFASTFSDAVTRNAAPDVLVFDNLGVMNGISVGGERFVGIAQDPTIRRDLIQVTGALDALLGPARGWTFLYSPSPNHAAARMLALRTPGCPNGSADRTGQSDVMAIVPMVATAYLEADAMSLQTYSDPDRLPPVGFKQETVRVGDVRPCGTWGNDRLAFTSVNASYEAETAIGHARVVMVLRKPAAQWQLLVAARDPVSNGAFMAQVPSLTARLEKDEQRGAPPTPARLLSPATGRYPRPSGGQRFGMFGWRSSPSADVVGEIVEFAYKDDARLFLRRPQPEALGHLSAGMLWTTRSVWSWRVWSITRAGDVVFSDVRTFPH